MEQPQKRCSKCKELKDTSFFHRHKGMKDGFNYWCKACYYPNAKSTTVATSSGAPKGVRKEEFKGLCFDYFPPSFLHQTWRMAKDRCARYEREFSLTVQDLHGLLVCFCAANYYSMDSKNPFKPSLDRIDNSKGYTLDNVRVCWLIENLCKNTFTDEQVIEFCKRKLGLSF